MNLRQRFHRVVQAGTGGAPASRHERGSAIVEFALVMPMLVVLVLGIIEFGFVFSSYIQIQAAAREGARLAAVNNACLLVGTCPDATTQLNNLIASTRSSLNGMARAGQVTVKVAYPTRQPWAATSPSASPTPQPRSPGSSHPVNNMVLTAKGVMRLEQTPTFGRWGSTC